MRRDTLRTDELESAMGRTAEVSERAVPTARTAVNATTFDFFNAAFLIKAEDIILANSPQFPRSQGL